MFRINGDSRIALCYRPLVLIANMALGVLVGLQPLLGERSAAATMQAFLILALQLTMAWICFKVLPDADRIISRFAGTQFLCEAVGTLTLVVASLASEDAASSAELQVSGFFISLVACSIISFLSTSEKPWSPQN